MSTDTLWHVIDGDLPDVVCFVRPTSDQVIARYVPEQSVDEWFREFQREHDQLKEIGRKELRELAYALHDDIPLGYEASMRLANWLIVATNRMQEGKEGKR